MQLCCGRHQKSSGQDWDQWDRGTRQGGGHQGPTGFDEFALVLFWAGDWTCPVTGAALELGL
jgi:hypothetical protein